MGGTPVVLDTNATVADSDSTEFAGGSLTVEITVNAQTSDRISIKHAGNAAGQIGVSGNDVSFGGIVIGSFSGTTKLVIALNDKATAMATQALLRSITYSSTIATPSTLDRTVKVTLTDGDGGTSNSPTKLVKMAQFNAAPVIGAFDGSVTYSVNTAPVVLDSNATITDADSLDFAGGSLTVSIAANYELTDLLGIKHTGTAAGQIGVSGSNVSYGGIVIGSFTRTSSLVINLNDKATRLAVQALLRSITFSVSTQTPSPLDRTINVTLTDGDGGTSNVPTKLVKVIPGNTAPVITAFDGFVTYTENAAPVVLDTNAVVTDTDSLNFATGRLTVSIVTNYQSTDILGIRHTGTAAGQIGVSGTEVSFGGVVIGTFTRTSSLVTTFNDKATRAAVQALLRSITFSANSDTPSPLDRTIRVSLTDGDGGTSNMPTKLVKVVPVNDAPVIDAFDGSVTYTENAAPIVLDSNAVITISIHLILPLAS